MKFDKELFCYEVVYSRSDELDDSDDITERFGTDTEAVERARYLSSISFYLYFNYIINTNIST